MRPPGLKLTNRPFCSSTVTYDTLVRAGVSCTSAYVPAKNTAAGSPYIARGSRGIQIVADELFSLEASGPVRSL
jgi:protein DJ-1